MQASVLAHVSLVAPSGAPQNLSSSNTSTSSFILRWEEPPLEVQNGEIIGYNITVTNRVEKTLPLLMDTANTTLIVSSLNDSTLYKVSVAARTRVGVGPFSEPISITTKYNFVPGKYQTLLHTASAMLLSIISAVVVATLLSSILAILLSVSIVIGLLIHMHKRKAKKYK